MIRTYHLVILGYYVGAYVLMVMSLLLTEFLI